MDTHRDKTSWTTGSAVLTQSTNMPDGQAEEITMRLTPLS